MCGSDVLITAVYTMTVYVENFSCSSTDNIQLFLGILNIIVGLICLYANHDKIVVDETVNQNSGSNDDVFDPLVSTKC